MTDLSQIDDPLTILVTADSWAAIDEPTPRKIWLTQVLETQGGIADTVLPGTYHYNVKLVDNEWITTLYPA